MLLKLAAGLINRYQFFVNDFPVTQQSLYSQLCIGIYLHSRNAFECTIHHPKQHGGELCLIIGANPNIFRLCEVEFRVEGA
jgi:hypothetical protein